MRHFIMIRGQINSPLVPGAQLSFDLKVQSGTFHIIPSDDLTRWIIDNPDLFHTDQWVFVAGTLDTEASLTVRAEHIAPDISASVGTP
ncbi:MAG: hypothetical protein WBH82_00935 [Arcanobacterium sp.]